MSTYLSRLYIDVACRSSIDVSPYTLLKFICVSFIFRKWCAMLYSIFTQRKIFYIVSIHNKKRLLLLLTWRQNEENYHPILPQWEAGRGLPAQPRFLRLRSILGTAIWYCYKLMLYVFQLSSSEQSKPGSRCLVTHPRWSRRREYHLLNTRMATPTQYNPIQNNWTFPAIHQTILIIVQK